jgi:signal transduction histidine kinase
MALAGDSGDQRAERAGPITPCLSAGAAANEGLVEIVVHERIPLANPSLPVIHPHGDLLEAQGDNLGDGALPVMGRRRDRVVRRESGLDRPCGVGVHLRAEPLIRRATGDSSPTICHDRTMTSAPLERWRPLFRGPFARWPRSSDAVLAILVSLAALFVTDEPGNDLVIRSISDIPVGAWILVAIAGAALYLRRSRPLVVLAVTLAAALLALALGYWDITGMSIVALYSVGRYAPDDRWNYISVVATVVVVVISDVVEAVPIGETVFGIVGTAVAWYIGRRVRFRGERTAQLARERATEAARIAAAERARIARELHDVVAHRVSLMTVQAGAAKIVAHDDPEAAVEAMEAVEKTGRLALDELRHLLDVLRPESDFDDRGPQPSLADIPRLVAQFRWAGLDVTLAMDGVAATQGVAPLQLSAYRIVQEALTNVLKHGGDTATAEVRLYNEGGNVVIEVVDDGEASTILPGSGHGIVGMRERAALLGGTLDAGARTEGGFRVVARLPVVEETG